MIDINVHGIKVTIEDIDHNIDVLSDFRDVFDDIIEDVIIERIKDIFRSQGDGTWDPRVSGGDWPLLIRTGALYRSLTDIGSRDNIYHATPHEVEFGSDIEYAEYVQRLRPILELVDDLETENAVAIFLDEVLQERFR